MTKAIVAAMPPPLYSRRKKSGGKTGGKDAQRLSFWFDHLGQKCPHRTWRHPLKPLERPIYSGRMEEPRGLQLSLISTTQDRLRTGFSGGFFLLCSNQCSSVAAIFAAVVLQMALLWASSEVFSSHFSPANYVSLICSLWDLLSTYPSPISSAIN